LDDLQRQGGIDLRYPCAPLQHHQTTGGKIPGKKGKPSLKIPPQWAEDLEAAGSESPD
jgi:hypothetical protein